MKRWFRAHRTLRAGADYPTHLAGRRQFMRQLGLVAAGSAVASVLPGCGPNGDSGTPPGDVRAPSDAMFFDGVGGDMNGPLLADSGGLADTVSAPADGGWWSDGVAPDTAAPLDLGPPADAADAGVGPDGADSGPDSGR